MKRKAKPRMDYTDWTVEDHEDHLRTHPDYQAYYADFDPQSIEPFIKEYAKQKYQIFEKNETYKEEYEAHQTQFLSEADFYIDMILQKKLFNLQCQWRAERIDLPLVDICEDFEYWEKHIRSCPFIPPITQEEVDLCLRFLQEDTDFYDLMDDYPDGWCWQNYPAFKNQLIVDDNEERAEDGDTLLEVPTQGGQFDRPDLYVFFDEHQNTEDLLRLPDLREEKDRRYKKESYRLQNKQREMEQKANGTWKEPEPYVYVPHLSIYSGVAKFVEAVEDDTMKESYKYYEHHSGTSESNRVAEEMEEYLDYLTNCDEVIPIEANVSWRSAVINAVRRYKQKKIAEMLVYAYDTYLLEFDEAQPVEQLIAQRVAAYKYDETEWVYERLMNMKARILDGRASLDGVRDFKY